MPHFTGADGQVTGEPAIWLPIQGGVPLPSSPLVAEPPKSRRPPALAPLCRPLLGRRAATAFQAAVVRRKQVSPPDVFSEFHILEKLFDSVQPTALLGSMALAASLHGIGELLQQFFLFPGQVDRGFHHHPA